MRLAGDCVWVSATWMDSSSLTRRKKYRAALALTFDYEGMRFAVTETYRRLVPDRLAQRIAEALLLAELAGAYSRRARQPGGDSLVTMNAGWRIPVRRSAVQWFS